MIRAGLLLVAAAVAAMIWANAGAGYEALWSTPVAGELSLRFVINDVLMAVFFLVVGLEIKRELRSGALSHRGALALPLACALGGMVVPAAIYLLVAGGGEAARGWAIPVATDIAFALAAVAVLGKRLPPAVRVLLLAVAVIDDLGAVLVIAVVFSGSIGAGGLALAAVGLALGVAARRMGRLALAGYAASFALLWAGLLIAGIHPTLAGVAVGLLVPATGSDSPAERAEHALAPYVAFAVMPLFALANAGVAINLEAVSAGSAAIAGIAVALLLGKPLGVVGGALIAVRLGITRLPEALGVAGVAIVGLACSIGFTMSLFIAELAFAGSALLDAGKLGVVVASGAAIIATLAVGLMAFSPAPASPPPRSPRLQGV